MGSGKHGFPKDFRLITSREFKRVFSDSKRISSKFFVLHIRRNDIDHPRLGFAISKRQIKLSCDRNRLKRIVRESFRLEASSLPNIDIIVTANHRAAKALRTTLWRTIDDHWKKVVQRY